MNLKEAPEPPQSEPHVVDLGRYRAQRAKADAAEKAQAAAEAKARRAAARGEPLLGRRPKAGLILVGVIAAAVLLTVLSRLVGG